MDRFVDTEEEYDQGEHPHNVTRHCTDIPCCLIFTVAIICFGYVMAYGFTNGNADFLALPTGKGEFCNGERPFLYYCNSTGLNHLNTVCVSECPNPEEGENASSSFRSCPFGEAEDYPTRPVGGLICIPKDPAEAVQLHRVLENPTIQRLLKLCEVFRSWQPILVVVVAATILSFLYNCVIEKCVSFIYYGSLFMVIFVTEALGASFIYISQKGEFEIPTVPEGLPYEDLTNDLASKLPVFSTGHPATDLIAGVSLCSLGFFCFCFGCCCAKSVSIALESLKDAGDCITDMPSLLWQPVVDLLLQMALFVVLASGFIHLVSCARMEKHQDQLHEFVMKFDYQEYYFIGFYIVMSYWLMEMCWAMSEFVRAYAVQLWFFETRGGLTDDVPSCVVIRGWCAGVTYHTGTFAFGSFIIALVRMVRDFAACVAKSSAESGNPCTACLATACACCVDCFQRCLRYMTRNAYIDVAINSNSFCKAAFHSMSVLVSYSAADLTLSAATLGAKIAGIGGIMASGVAIMYLLLTHWKELSDPENPQFVEHRMSMYIVSALVSGFIAAPFMALLDAVSDILLFCNALDKKRTPPPPSIAEEEFNDPPVSCCCCAASPVRSNDLNGEKRALMA